MLMGDGDEVGGKVISLVVADVGNGHEAFPTYEVSSVLLASIDDAVFTFVSSIFAKTLCIVSPRIRRDMTAVTAARNIKVFHGDHHDDDIHKSAGGGAFDVFSVRLSSFLNGLAMMVTTRNVEKKLFGFVVYTVKQLWFERRR
jgi:hypothetical protein